MLRYGLINELGTGQNLGFARVYFDELDVKSDWLSLPTSGTKEIKSWVTFPVKTQVAVLMHRDGEQGEIIGSTWSNVDAPPSFANDHTRGIEFPDGTKIFYDWTSRKLTINTGTTGQIEITGNVKVTGNIEATQQVTAMTLTPATKVTLSLHQHTSFGTPPTPGI